MDFINSAMDGVGVAIVLVSYVLILTAAFQKGTWWGLGSLMWPVAMVFVLLNFRETYKWAMGMLLGYKLVVMF